MYVRAFQHCAIAPYRINDARRAATLPRYLWSAIRLCDSQRTYLSVEHGGGYRINAHRLLLYNIYIYLSFNCILKYNRNN